MSQVVEALVDYVSGFPIQTKTVKGLLLYDVPGLHKQYNFYINYQKIFSTFFIFVTPRTQSMSSTRDNDRTPIRRALQVCQALQIDSKN